MRRGMRLGEALARCPRLALVPPDPMGVADAWDTALERLEGIGAAVEPARPGLACFDSHGLLRLHAGRLEGVLAAARAALLRRVSGEPALVPRLGAGPTRFCAVAAASRARARRPELVAGPEALAGEPVGLLALRQETAALPEALERLGILTLADLAALPRAALADRFGRAGLLAADLVAGHDSPLRPRRPGERLEEILELPEAASGQQLERALGMLVDRLLARRERRGRMLRSVALSARLVEGGTWRERVVFREALADPGRMRLALASQLARLPAPAETLRLAVERFGPPHARRAGAVRRRRRSAPRAAARGGSPDACRRGARGGPARARRRSGLACARAADGAGTVHRRAGRGRRVTGPKRLSRPRHARVRAREDGCPLAVDGRDVEAVRESWLIEDRWWTDAAATPALLGDRHGLRSQRRGLPRPRGGRLVLATLTCDERRARRNPAAPTLAVCGGRADRRRSNTSRLSLWSRRCSAPPRSPSPPPAWASASWKRCAGRSVWSPAAAAIRE